MPTKPMRDEIERRLAEISAPDQEYEWVPRQVYIAHVAWLLGLVCHIEDMFALAVAEADTKPKTWPRTEVDHADQAFFASPPYGTVADYINDWQAHRLCGCGATLATDQEHLDGVCDFCLELGTRTPRP